MSAQAASRRHNAGSLCRTHHPAGLRRWRATARVARLCHRPHSTTRRAGNRARSRVSHAALEPRHRAPTLHVAAPPGRPGARSLHFFALLPCRTRPLARAAWRTCTTRSRWRTWTSLARSAPFTTPAPAVIALSSRWCVAAAAGAGGVGELAGSHSRGVRFMTRRRGLGGPAGTQRSHRSHCRTRSPDPIGRPVVWPRWGAEGGSFVAARRPLPTAPPSASATRHLPTRAPTHSPQEDLLSGEDIARCPSCSLRIRVIADLDALEAKYGGEGGELNGEGASSACSPATRASPPTSSNRPPCLSGALIASQPPPRGRATRARGGPCAPARPRGSARAPRPRARCAHRRRSWRAPRPSWRAPRRRG